jgi:hypothetical protein
VYRLAVLEVTVVESNESMLLQEEDLGLVLLQAVALDMGLELLQLPVSVEEAVVFAVAAEAVAEDWVLYARDLASESLPLVVEIHISAVAEDTADLMVSLAVQIQMPGPVKQQR